MSATLTQQNYSESLGADVITVLVTPLLMSIGIVIATYVMQRRLFIWRVSNIAIGCGMYLSLGVVFFTFNNVFGEVKNTFNSDRNRPCVAE